MLRFTWGKSISRPKHFWPYPIVFWFNGKASVTEGYCRENCCSLFPVEGSYTHEKIKWFAVELVGVFSACSVMPTSLSGSSNWQEAQQVARLFLQFTFSSCCLTRLKMMFLCSDSDCYSDNLHPQTTLTNSLEKKNREYSILLCLSERGRFVSFI